jgi:heme-degrading monooxygenase HmoA
MAITEIIHFGAEPLLDTHTPRITANDTIQKTVNAPKGVKPPQHFVIGTQVQDKGAVQITSEWDGVQDYVNFKNTPEFSSFINSVRSFYGEPNNIFHVALDRSAFGPDGPATAKVVEFVQTYFPTSRVTPEFQRQVEEDFFSFDEIYSKGAKGTVSWAFGWVLEEQEHENIKGEKAKCFFVTRGWESMHHFEESVKNDAYKKAIPLLLVWNAPWKMVGVCFFAV